MHPPPKLLDRIRTAIRARHYSIRTEESYVAWAKRYILFHNRKHPSAMGAMEINEFLSDLAVVRNVSASTQNQALSALLFLYRVVLEEEVPWLENLIRAKRPARIPVVMTRREISALIAQMNADSLSLIVRLLYGSGMRMLEALRLRVKDLDFARGELTIRDAKGRKDRITILPQSLISELQAHLELVRELHDRDRAAGGGRVYLPEALSRKYQSAPGEWVWQYVFRRHASAPTRDPESVDAITSTNAQSSEQFAAPLSQRESRKPSESTRSGTPSPRICSRAATTSAPSRSSSATRT